MKLLEVFDPAMCCSTGVCGPSVDPALAAFAADLDWVASAGADVRRYNLGQEPGAFAQREDIRSLLHESGDAVLPVVVVDGEVRSKGRYPTREELAAWAGLEHAAPVVSTEIITELAAVGAAIAANCEPCLKFHVAAARKLGLSNDQLATAVRSAQLVKEAPAAAMLDLAAKLLRAEASAFVQQPVAAPAEADSGSCCSSPEVIQIGAAPTTGACC